MVNEKGDVIFTEMTTNSPSCTVPVNSIHRVYARAKFGATDYWRIIFEMDDEEKIIWEFLTEKNMKSIYRAIVETYFKRI